MESKLGGNTFKQDENGNWVLEKAEIPKMKTKPKYKDAPRYPLIYDYEGEFKKNFNKTVNTIEKQLKSKLDEFIK